MKFVVDLWLDGYDSEEEMKEACLAFIRENLDISASSVSVDVYEPACTCGKQGVKVICGVCGGVLSSQ